MFLMNLDGFEKVIEGICFGEIGCFNCNGVDLNCNFFD